VRDPLLAGKVAYLDASVEPVPRGVPDPTEREVFFCTKADLVALFWDGVSVGTGRLLRYFQDSGKNLLVGFI